MCRLQNKYTESKTFIGYKIVVRVGKRFYSPFTGIEYKKGEVPHSNIAFTRFDDSFKTKKKWALLMESISYQRNYSKKTSVIVGCNSADWLFNEFHHKPEVMKLHPSPLEIVKMTISGDLHYSRGCWAGNGYKAITGNHIDKIEIIK